MNSMSIDNVNSKVLLVDDNPMFLKLMGFSFQKKGFKCLTAPSAIQALDLLQSERPDIILSDYSMPDMNGFEFREELIKSPTLNNIPFIFFTSFSDSELMIEGLNLKAVDYISKETNPEVIVTKVDNILSTVKEQRQQSLLELRKGVEALQIKSVPQSPPHIQGFDTQFLYHSYQNYPGGDFIDFLSLQDDIIVVLGDVMGKKWGAWFFSFIFLSYIRTAIRLCVADGNHSTAHILKKINMVIADDPALEDIFSTLSLLRIHKPTGRLYYTGAGDLPLIWFRAQMDTVEVVHSTGMLLGLFREAEYEEKQILMQPGDKLLMITDGIIDFEDVTGKKSDYARFVETITPVLQAAHSFTGIQQRFKSGSDLLQVDDRSLIYFEKK